MIEFKFTLDSSQAHRIDGFLSMMTNLFIRVGLYQELGLKLDNLSISFVVEQPMRLEVHEGCNRLSKLVWESNEHPSDICPGGYKWTMKINRIET
jgi:hypothetical protein